MKISRVKSNKESFHEVSFEDGFNVILAERTEGSTSKDSRNGRGKTTLVEIIHFCLGADFKKGALDIPDLFGWSFTLDFELEGQPYSVTREVNSPDLIIVDGDFTNWPIKPTYDDLNKFHHLTRNQWCHVLGNLVFDLPLESKTYSPTFRNLISYFARRGVEGFQTPLTYFRNQQEWSKQVHNAYLLGLGMEYPTKFQELKDEEKNTKKIKKIAGKGYFKDIVGSIGELEAERATKTQEVAEFRKNLDSFKVHPEYLHIQTEADNLTQEIQKLVNSQYMDDVLKKRYTDALSSEDDVSLSAVSSVYEETGLHFPQPLTKTLEEVHDFHMTILTNRRSYLGTEIEKLTKAIEGKSEKIRELSEQRAEQLSVLQSHGALEEHSRLSGRLANLESELESIKLRLKSLKEFDDRITDLQIRMKDLLRLAKQDLEERRELIDSAIIFFNENAKTLYESGGTLAIEIKEAGYSFKPEIEHARSQGIGYMRVFCYDLMLTELQIKLSKQDFLIHDSTVFDGVDERQFAKALELAAGKAKEFGFQYICLLNSDVVPTNDFTPEFKEEFNNSIRLILKDDTPEASLLGFRRLSESESNEELI